MYISRTYVISQFTVIYSFASSENSFSFSFFSFDSLSIIRFFFHLPLSSIIIDTYIYNQRKSIDNNAKNMIRTKKTQSTQRPPLSFLAGGRYFHVISLFSRSFHTSGRCFVPFTQLTPHNHVPSTGISPPCFHHHHKSR